MIQLDHDTCKDGEHRGPEVAMYDTFGTGR
jgi:hypothetical protein